MYHSGIGGCTVRPCLCFGSSSHLCESNKINQCFFFCCCLLFFLTGLSPDLKIRGLDETPVLLYPACNAADLAASSAQAAHEHLVKKSS